MDKTDSLTVASVPVTFDSKLKFPSSMVIVGASFSGKTFLTLDIIRKRQIIFNKRIDKVIYVFANYQNAFKQIAEKNQDVLFVGTREEAESHLDPKLNCLLILDDQMLSFENDSKSNKEITDWFIRRVHHENCAVVCILQNLFAKSLRCVMLNAIYLVLFKNIRDQGSILRLNSQFSPGNPRYLLEAMEDTSKTPYRFLFIDFSPEMNDRFRVRNFIYPILGMKVYIPKNKNE